MSTDLVREDDVEENPSSVSSRMELKRIHQWLTQEESTGSELFSNKRQVVETDSGSRTSFLTPPLMSAWDSSLVPNFLFDPANAQHSSHLLGRYISPLNQEVLHGSSLNLDTIRKVTVNNQVCESQNMPQSMLQFYDSTPSFGQTCSSIDKSFTLPGPNLSYDKGDENVFSTFHPFGKGVESFALMGQSLQKADYNIFSYNKGHENVMSNANVVFSQGCEMAFMVPSQEKADKNSDQTSQEVRRQTISFGNYQKETTMVSPVPVIASFENFSHSPAEDNMSSQYPPYANSSRVDTFLPPKSKDSKTAKKGSTTNTFPSNVKSLLSTGMFDGVTVKYYSWSREKNLIGVIKGTGYLCGCSDCNLNKVLNAYEFEQHANCKTKHPNNHIYFENGKTIYGVVQELKNTPQEKLFDAIQNVTGSDINRTNFNTWKASYHVASLELQRIYGKDAVVTLA
ncbi:unnamed protein product [Brassica oleracea var. botrytis]|uniref:Tify domain-containing protein n=1 Tax=Brassica oleracea var. oleracea TaxID=109376 RepID=A0A0D3B0Z6_BRAOL|nr:PREDICTED: uncharacterized protein LOC106336147 [Brassica oleracea var. oleracea]